MVASLILLASVGPAGFTFREVNRPASPVFLEGPHLESSPNRSLMVHGKSTGIVFPSNLEPYTKGYDASGHPVGGLSGQFSGAYSGELGYAIKADKSGYKVVRPLKGFQYATVTGVDQQKRILGVTFNSLQPDTDGIPQDSHHGFLVEGSKIIDLGWAWEVAFTDDGSIRGYYLGNSKRQPVTTIVDGDGYRYRFTWKDGKRIELPG